MLTTVRALLGAGHSVRLLVVPGGADDEVVWALRSRGTLQVRRIPLSPSLFRGVGRLSDFAGRWLPLPEGLSHAAAVLPTAAVPTDDSLTLTDLGLTWRDPRKSVIESFA